MRASHSLAVLIIGLATLSSIALGAQVKGVRAAIDRPVAVRGGVLMMPLTAQTPGNQWPSAIDVRLADGRELRGMTAWVEAAPQQTERRWTQDPRGVLLRLVTDDDDNSTIPPGSITGPYLLVEIPPDAVGELRLGKQRLHPIWIEKLAGDPLQDSSPANERPVLALAHDHDRPDPESPFEYWRWVLLADRLGYVAAPPAGEPCEQLAAQYTADLWRWGLARLHRQSPRIAEQCRDLLTHICVDRRQPFAAWIADPAQVATLLAILVDDSRSGSALLAGAVAWLDSQETLMVWPAGETDEHVHMNIATTSRDVVIARARWRGESDSPAMVELDPGVLMRLTFERPPLPPKPPIGLQPTPEPQEYVLELQAGARSYAVAFGPRAVVAQPPHVQFRLLAPHLTLVEAQAQARALPIREPMRLPTDRATAVQLRRLGGRWEAFIECRRPRLASSALRQLPDQLRSPEDLRGCESITLLLGPDDDDSVNGSGANRYWITVPEDGWTRIGNAENDPTLQVHKKAHEDRWYCRIVLPAAWFSAAEANPALVGFVRGHGDSLELETGPAASVPWRCNPGRVAIDLAHWDDLPRE